VIRDNRIGFETLQLRHGNKRSILEDPRCEVGRFNCGVPRFVHFDVAQWASVYSFI